MSRGDNLRDEIIKGTVKELLMVLNEFQSAWSDELHFRVLKQLAKEW